MLRTRQRRTSGDVRFLFDSFQPCVLQAFPDAHQTIGKHWTTPVRGERN